MKHVPSLSAEPAGLAQWRAENQDNWKTDGRRSASVWREFKEARAAYDELLNALIERQQGLCAYCEQRLTHPDAARVLNDYQVEHVLPKSGGLSRVVDWTNLMACCGGGTWKYHQDPSRHGSPPSDNLSCGQTKGEDLLPDGCDPRSFPWHEPLVYVGLDGKMLAKHDACERAGVRDEDLQFTLDERLGLNCPRLRMAREHVVHEVQGWVVKIIEETLRQSPNLPGALRASIRQDLVGGRLRPDPNGQLQRFWSSERQYLGPLAEAWIHDNAALLNFT